MSGSIQFIIYQFGFLLHLLDIRFHIDRMALKCLSSQVWQKIPNRPKSASQVPGKIMYVCMSDMKAEEILAVRGNYQERGYGKWRDSKEMNMDKVHGIFERNCIYETCCNSM